MLHTLKSLIANDFAHGVQYRIQHLPQNDNEIILIRGGNVIIKPIHESNYNANTLYCI